MNYSEEATVLVCEGERMVGILARPEAPLSVGVVVIVGGPQYRAGSHRQFVQLSRALAAKGFAVLRFDYRGMGDSEGQLRDFEAVSKDVGLAVDALQSNFPEVRRVVLWGLCDGASAALLYCDETNDPRIAGLCLLNPWVRSAASLARTHVKHYYAKRLLQREFWLKLMRGGVAWSALAGLVGNVRAAVRSADAAKAGASAQSASRSAPLAFQDRMARGWLDFSGRICLILSQEDYTAKEFVEYTAQQPAWRQMMDHGQRKQYDIDADHTFSGRVAGDTLLLVTLEWLSGFQLHQSPGTAVAAKSG